MSEQPSKYTADRWSAYWRPDGFSIWVLRCENEEFAVAAWYAHLHLIAQRGGELKVIPTPAERSR